MQTTFSSPDEHERYHTALQQARALTARYVQEATREKGSLRALPLNDAICAQELACGPLAFFVAEGYVTIAMIKRWTMEAIETQARAHTRPLLSAQDLYRLSVDAGDTSGDAWMWLPEEIQGYYSRLADLINLALGLCAACGERKPGDLHEIAGLFLCSTCEREGQ